FAHDDEVLSINLDLGSRILPEQDPVSLFHRQRKHLSFVIALTAPDGDDFALLRLILCRIGNNDATPGGIGLFYPTDQDSVVQGSKFRSHSLTPFVYVLLIVWFRWMTGNC